MSYCTGFSKFLLFLLFGITSITSNAAIFADSVVLYTPYTKISVPPGEKIEYTIDIINNTKEVKTLELTVAGIPGGWNHTLKSGAWNISQLSILPSERKNFSLMLEVPLKVRKGSYRFRVTAGGAVSLPLTVTVSEEGTFKTEFTTQQANMEGHAKSNFTFSTVINNRTTEKQLYSLRAAAPKGWIVTFKPGYIQATSAEVEPNATKDVSVEVNPPANIEAGTYLIPVSAENSATSASLNLEVVITGTYNMELTTPTGLLSADITAGDEKRLELLINNTGSSILSDITLSPSGPNNWEVTMDPKKIERIDPGKSAQVFATIKAGKRAIAGDYITSITANTTEATSKVTFRMSVKTPMLLGWIGIVIIIAAIGSVYFLFRKYGRR
jgi:uncharacterized membrane protein